MFPPNPQSIESITLVSTDDPGSAAFSVRSAGVDQRLVAGAGVWQKGIFKTTDRYAETSEHIAANGG